VHEPGIVIALEVDTNRPLEIEAVFDRDFQLNGRGNVGDTSGEWDPALRAFHFGDEAGRFEPWLALHPLPRLPKSTRATTFPHAMTLLFWARPKKDGHEAHRDGRVFHRHAPLASLYGPLIERTLSGIGVRGFRRILPGLCWLAP